MQEGRWELIEIQQEATGQHSTEPLKRRTWQSTGKPSWFHLPVTEGCFLVAITLIWGFLHLCDSSRVWIKICIFFWTSVNPVGSWPGCHHYELLVVLMIDFSLSSTSSTPPNCSLQQMRAQDNVSISCCFFDLGFSSPALLDLPWLSFGTSISFFLLPLNLFPCNYGCLLILLWRNTNHWPKGEFYCYQLFQVICAHECRRGTHCTF